MPTLKRPTSPKIKTPKIKRKTSLRKPLRKKISTKKATLTGSRSTSSKHKKKHVVHLGTCYENLGCKGKILLKQVTKSHCKDLGGKSWKSKSGCESIR